MRVEGGDRAGRLLKGKRRQGASDTSARNTLGAEVEAHSDV